jgi:hypothetical protein
LTGLAEVARLVFWVTWSRVVTHPTFSRMSVGFALCS